MNKKKMDLVLFTAFKSINKVKEVPFKSTAPEFRPRNRAAGNKYTYAKGRKTA